MDSSSRRVFSRPPERMVMESNSVGNHSSLRRKRACRLAVGLLGLCALPPEPARAAAAPAHVVRFDFETGDLQGWRVVEGRFAKLLNDRVMFRNRRTRKFNKQGRYFLDTVEAGGDRQTGVIESPVFVLEGPKISMLVGGGRHSDTYVALCTLDGREALKAQGRNDEVLQRVEWDAAAWVGQRVFLRIVDRHTTGWGHVTFDDFRAVGRLDPVATRRRWAKLRAQRQAKQQLAQLDDQRLDALRRAVLDLSHTFPRRYAAAPALLKRLDGLRARVRRARQALTRAAPDAADQARRALADLKALSRDALLANPLLTAHPIVFVVRRQYKPDHHNTATLFQRGEINDRKFLGGSALKILDKPGAAPRTLLRSRHGVIRDPEVNFSGDRIVFAMRRDARDDYHIYEIRADGSGLRQLTFAPGVSDIDPAYLPNGDIVFASTREPKYCMCNRHIMANLFRMSPDGSSIRQIGRNTLFEGHPSVLPDGRILYDRWEYVDRNFGDAQGLWAINPDGANPILYWGNNTWSPGAVIDGRAIPGSGQTVCIFSSCHDRPWGALAIIDRRLGLEGRGPVVRIWPARARAWVRANGRGYGFDLFKRVQPKYEDPYPLYAPDSLAGAGKYFLCSRTTGQGDQMGLYLVDVFGNETLVHAEPPGCYDPMPLMPRPRPPVRPDRVQYEQSCGALYVHNVYLGSYMERVRPGSVKWIRVVECPVKRFWTYPRWTGQGTIAPAMNWHDFNSKRILGVAPVEPDGSAYFLVPAGAFVYFQLLDADGMMVQSMRSGTAVQPGERTGCIGCHDERLTAPPNQRMPLAVRRPASRLQGWRGPVRPFGYLKEVQPVFNRYCLRCHDFGGKGADKVILASDRTLTFNASYNELWRKGYIHVIGAGPAAIQPPYSWGSHASKLVKILRQGHRDVRLDPESFDRIVTWIDLNAPYYPSYASAYPKGLAGRSPLTSRELNRLEALTGVPFSRLAGCRANRGPQISFDRPELSPCLQKLQAAARRKALAIIQAGQRRLAHRPRADMDGFAPCEVDQARAERYARRRRIEMEIRRALAQGRKAFDPR